MLSARKIRLLRAVKKYSDRFGVRTHPSVKAALALMGRMFLSEIYDERDKSITACIDDFKFVVPRQFQSHYLLRQYEPTTRRALCDAIRPGMTVVDVGAHIGFYSLLLSKAVTASGRVHAIEPFSDNLAYLRDNLQLNHLTNVVIHPFAAGRTSETCQFHITESSDSNGFYPHPLAKTVSVVEVQVKPLDEIIKTPVDVIKIDVEGAEMVVLGGMSRILNESANLTIFIEWMPACLRRAGHDPLDLPARLQELGFQILVLNDQEGEVLDLEQVIPAVKAGNLPDSWYVNILAERK